MHIVVCIKLVPDPDLPAVLFEVVPEDNSVRVATGASPVISPYDSQALEAALRLRDEEPAGNNVKITAICVGGDAHQKTLRQALALGADEAIVIHHENPHKLDAAATSHILAATIQTLTEVDIVLTGRQSADSDAGLVGPLVGERLGWPIITFAGSLKRQQDRIYVTRSFSMTTEDVALIPPGLITVSHEIGTVRTASLRDLMRSNRKPIRSLTLDNIGLDPSAIIPLQKVVRRYRPTTTVDCEFIDGADDEEIVTQLVKKLESEGLI